MGAVKTAICFDRVSRKFTLHHERPHSFQELVVNLFQRDNSSQEEFWALRDVSFTVDQGETVGLIGPNGAGKSTVLKLISRIIEPTSGRTWVNGRVGALLELGSGFHPDLTGRENIYLNGSILGLSRRDIAQRLKSIVQFAELERFIDVPVRNYSSGMLMRLGFSVATSFQPEILLIDEVLAVGDQAFQAKCLRRIAHMQKQGTTILLVSHSLDTVRRLCHRAVWLDEGEAQAVGPVDEVIVKYLSRVWKGSGVQLIADGDTAGRGRRWGSGEAFITKVEFLDDSGCVRRVFQTGGTFVARIHYRARQPVHKPAFGVAIYREDGSHVNGPNTALSGYEIDVIDGEGAVDYVIESLPLLPGRYEFTATIYDYHSVHPYDHQHRAYTFEVQAAGILENEGLVHIPCRWNHRCDPDLPLTPQLEQQYLGDLAENKQ
jgi:ABC-type polysaccharide/polyol phosphate transport system ATPase subunit